MHKRYIVPLTDEERENLEALVRRGPAYASEAVVKISKSLSGLSTSSPAIVKL